MVAISLDRWTYQTQKCDLGANHRAQGLAPACVAAGRGRAIEIGGKGELIARTAAAGRRVCGITTLFFAGYVAGDRPIYWR